MRLLLGAVVGILLVWLYRSTRVRDEAQRRLATAPEPLRHAATSARAASASQLERVAQAFEAAPVAQPVREAGQAATPSIQELPDGSRVGDAAT